MKQHKVCLQLYIVLNANDIPFSLSNYLTSNNFQSSVHYIYRFVRCSHALENEWNENEDHKENGIHYYYYFGFNEMPLKMNFIVLSNQYTVVCILDLNSHLSIMNDKRCVCVCVCLFGIFIVNNNHISNTETINSLMLSQSKWILISPYLSRTAVSYTHPHNYIDQYNAYLPISLS